MVCQSAVNFLKLKYLTIQHIHYLNMVQLASMRISKLMVHPTQETGKDF